MKKENTEKFVKKGILKNLKNSIFETQISNDSTNQEVGLRRNTFSEREYKNIKSIPKLSKEESNDYFKKQLTNINDHSVALDTTREFFKSK